MGTPPSPAPVLPIGRNPKAVAAGWLALFGVGCAPLGVGAVVFGGLAWRELRASSDQLGRRRAGFGIVVGTLEVVVVAVLVAPALR